MRSSAPLCSVSDLLHHHTVASNGLCIATLTQASEFVPPLCSMSDLLHHHEDGADGDTQMLEAAAAAPSTSAS